MLTAVRLPTDRRPMPARVLARVRAAMARDGAVALEGLFPLPLLREIRGRVLRLHDSGVLRERALIRDIGGRYAALLPFEGPFLRPAFYANPRLLEIMAGLLGTHHCIGSLETVISMPGAYRQHLHIDGPIRFDQSSGGTARAFRGDLSGLPPYAVTLCVPLCDVTEDNGPTAIWAGSHRAALQARPPSDAQIRRRYRMETLAGELGSAFLFDYRVFHGGLPNETPQPRPLLMMVFTRSWFRDPNLAEVYPRVAIRRRDLARVAERHRHLFALAPASLRPLWARGRKGPIPAEFL